jgi:hypothetical protein
VVDYQVAKVNLETDITNSLKSMSFASHSRKVTCASDAAFGSEKIPSRPPSRTSQDTRPAANWKTETISRVSSHGNPCRRARDTRKQKEIEWKLITDLPVRSRKDLIEKLQWYALRWKNRAVIGLLQSRGVQAQDRATPSQSALDLLHTELAGILDDDAQPFSPDRLAEASVDSRRDRPT